MCCSCYVYTYECIKVVWHTMAANSILLEEILMRAAKFSLSLIDTVVSRCKNRRRDSIVCAFTIHLIHVHVCTCIISFKLLSLKFSSHSAETWKQAVIEARCRWGVGARRRWWRQLGAGWRHTEDTIADSWRYHGVWRRVWLARWGGLGMALYVVIDVISYAQPIFLKQLVSFRW